MSQNNSDLCRICMEGKGTNEIFNTTIAGDLVANLLIDLADIEVDYDDPLPIPNKICDHCQHSLVQACSLRKQIRESDNILRDMVKDIEVQPIEVSLNDQELYNAVIHVSEDSAAESLVEEAPPSPNVEEVIETELANCCACTETFETIDEVRAHLQRVHGKHYKAGDDRRASFLKHVAVCDLCGNRYPSVNQMKKHKFQYKHLVTCEVCGALVRKLIISTHMHRHSNEMVECELCQKSYKKCYIKEHKVKMHGDEKKRWACDLCTHKTFTSKFFLRAHMKRHDANYERRFVGACNVCGKQFESKSKLETHMFIHIGKKRFQCEHCSAKFMHQSDWKRHAWTHTGSPYSCPKCFKFIDRPSLLRTHESVGCAAKGNNSRRVGRTSKKCKKPYQKFTASEQVEYEEIVKIESYTCDKCLDTFATQSELVMHDVTHEMMNIT